STQSPKSRNTRCAPWRSKRFPKTSLVMNDCARPRQPGATKEGSDMSDTYGRLTLDPHSPMEMAQKVEAGGVTNARRHFNSTLALSVLAGAFIGLGAMFSTVVGTDTGLGYGVTRLLVGLSFSLGLILVVVGGAELFTGNNLIVMAWAHRKVSTGALCRNW